MSENNFEFCDVCKMKNVILNWFIWNIDECGKLCLNCYKKESIEKNKYTFYVTSDSRLVNFPKPIFPKKKFIKIFTRLFN